jgi:hypothetical protein
MGGKVELNLNRNLLKQTLRNKGIVVTHSSLSDNISTFINNKFKLYSMSEESPPHALGYSHINLLSKFLA